MITQFYGFFRICLINRQDISHSSLLSFTYMIWGKSNAESLVNCNWYFLASICYCFQSKEEVMAVRLREADRIAAVAELQQHIAELEIQVTSDGIKCVTWYWLLFVLCGFFLPLSYLVDLLWIQGTTLQSGMKAILLNVPPL